ncbi:hypothetical protein VaNZ11_009286, partial [Volvox africanus]
VMNEAYCHPSQQFAVSWQPVMQLTRSGYLLLIISCLFGFAAIFWPSGPATQIDGAAKNESTSCPLGFTSADGDKPRWIASNYPLHVGINGHAFAAKSRNGAVGRRDSAPSLDSRYHLFYNATIWTGDEASSYLEKSGGFADALLVRQGGIVAVGPLADVRRALSEDLTPASPWDAGGIEGADAIRGNRGTRPGQDEVVEYDLGGRFVMPGFVDAHVHLVPAGLSLSRVDLRGVASRAALQARVAQAAAGLGPSDWLLGGQWDEGDWGGEMPSAQWLDEVCGGRPAYLTRHDLHMALANTAAMELANIGPNTADPEGGIIDRDGDTGRPTGLLRERAMSCVEAVIPTPSVAERRAALAAASSHALSRGVTTLVDMGRYLAGDESGPWVDMEEVYLPAADSGNLSVRIFAMVPLRSWRRLSSWVAVRGRAHPGGRLFWGGLKEFADGSLGSRTALMWEPFSDIDSGSGSGCGGGSGQEAVAPGAAGEISSPDPSLCGQRGLALTELRDLTSAAVRAGLQVAIHAIGDRAVDEVAEVYGQALTAALDTTGAEDVLPPKSSNHSGQGLSADDALHGNPAGVSEQMKRLGKALRLRIEHVQHLSDTAASAARLAHSGLTPVPNPLHLLTDAAMLGPRLGSRRAARAFALASLCRAGLRPALASDWPVVDLQPLTGVYAAVHRHPPRPDVANAMRRKLRKSSRFQLVGERYPLVGDYPDDGRQKGDNRYEVEDCGSGVGSDGMRCCYDATQGASGRAVCGADGFGLCEPEGAAEERLSLEQALLGHTAWAAVAAGLEDYVGRLAPGLRADFVELSDSLAQLQLGGERLGAAEKDNREVTWASRLRLSGERLKCCLPVVARTWLDGQLVYDMNA